MTNWFFASEHHRIQDTMADLLQQIHAQAPGPSGNLRRSIRLTADQYFVDVVMPEPQEPIRVQAYVGHRLAQIEMRDQQPLEGEVL